jgi:signal transduction histidine kinase
MLASLGLVLGLTVADPAGAACERGEALTPGPDALRVPIEEQLALLVDEARALSFEDVSGPVACARFGTPPDRSQITTPGGGRHWLRFRIDLRGARTRHWLLFLPIANFERACAWLPLVSGGQAVRCIGIGEPQPTGALRHNRMLFALPDDLDPERPALLSFESRAPQTVRGALVSAEAFFSEDERAQFLGGLFNGLLLATALYNLIFFVAARDRASLYFAIHLLGLGLAMIGFEGRGREYLWPWLGPLGASLPTAMLATAFLFGCLCGRDFLATRERAPRVDRLLQLAMLPAIVSFPLSVLSIGLAEQATAIAALAFVLSLISAATVVARSGYRPAVYLLGGLSVFLAGLISVALRTLGLVGIPESWGVPLTRAGLVVASIAISVGLGRRVIELRRERDQAAREVTQLEASLRRREQMAAMGSLVAGVAHEVRNPLFGISSTVDALEARVRHEGVTAHLETLRGQVGRLGKLMNDLLEYGRPRELERTPEQVQGVIEEASRACDYLARASGARIETRTNGPLPALLVDRKRVVQVFQNLLENALRHSPPGGTVVVELDPAERDGRRLVRVSVRDHGTGFALADLPHVFEPFFTRRRGGTGLGLSIVQQIVEQHAGSVEAHNDATGGACVVVWLPLAAPSD